MFDPGVLLEWQHQLAAWRDSAPLLFPLTFFALFVLVAALALPLCALLSLAAGASFGFVSGTLLINLACTLGATLAMLVARHLLRTPVQRRWGARLARIEAPLERDGPLVLFTLRLVPVVPYPLLNPLMGLTRVPASTFAVASFAGMLPGSAAYALAGTDLARWLDGGSLWSPTLVVAIGLLALLPWLGRWWWRRAEAAA